MSVIAFYTPYRAARAHADKLAERLRCGDRSISGPDVAHAYDVAAYEALLLGKPWGAARQQCQRLAKQYRYRDENGCDIHRI